MTFELPFYPYPITIYDLPPELLIHIFRFCVPCDIYSFTTATKRPTPVLQPLSLAGVCRPWRNLIIQSPHLWSHLQLKVNARGQVPFVRAWLARAQKTPLSISLYYDVEDRIAMYFIFEEVVGLVSEASSRWVELNVRVPDYFLFLLFGDCTSMSGAKLDVLRIHKANFVWENPVSCTPFRLLGGLPAPRTLALQGMSLDRVVVGWKNLTRVSAEGVALGECLKALHQAPKLEECTFVNINPGHVNDEVGYPTSIITHPHLHTLRIENTFVGDALLRRLYLPSLQAFSYIPISNPFHGYSHPFAFATPLSDFSTLETLTLRSRCVLQRLSVPVYVPAEAFARLLDAICTIKELVLDFGAVPPGVAPQEKCSSCSFPARLRTPARPIWERCQWGCCPSSRHLKCVPESSRSRGSSYPGSSPFPPPLPFSGPNSTHSRSHLILQLRPALNIGRSVDYTSRSAPPPSRPTSIHTLSGPLLSTVQSSSTSYSSAKKVRR
ncbi:unnamed protein product [Cyclocybe aegerita]|uniref:F-box domain-containing protein n=1 Tax=Cyclocybe aegerita TaxID=1973307 RepID=A0A8S0XNF5_CYCAE|nr:unnamed protein product [Cyclocybe aegerita]